MDIETVNRIKRIAIIALASDDRLVETLVLKGGNAIDLAYKSSIGEIPRTSFDLDYSIDDGNFDDSMGDRIRATLEATFNENGYQLFEFKFSPRPKKGTLKELAEFWGGYRAEFKVIPHERMDERKGNANVRRNPMILRPNNSTKFELEFSKFEYVEDKVAISVDGYKIYIYSAEMIVFEKVRALCQQLPGYKDVVPSFSPRARARDFYDIHLIMEGHKIKADSPGNKELIGHIFAAKRVPLSFIQELQNARSLHEDDWKSVIATLPQSSGLESFDFYFSYVIEKFGNLTFP